MEPVDILRDYPSQQARLLESDHSGVALVWLGSTDAGPAKRGAAPVALPFQGIRYKFVVLNGVAT